MTVINKGSAHRLNHLGLGPVSKATGTLAATTVDLYIVTGGQVLITAMWGIVTTAITVANSYKLVHAPTTGASQDLCAATDIGTTDTIVGTLLTFGDCTTTAPQKLMSIGYGAPLGPSVVTTGKVQHTSAGTDGAITWYLMWHPLTEGAQLVAA
jgi:hypothetical protein